MNNRTSPASCRPAQFGIGSQCSRRSGGLPPARRSTGETCDPLKYIALSIFVVALGLSHSARAATDTWSASPTNGSWSAAANWSTLPASGDSLVFGASTITTSTDNLMTPATYTLDGITFNAGASAYTITSGTTGTNGFTLAGPITNNGANRETINDLIALSGADTITTNTGGGNITLGGVISGGGLTAAGTGALTLSGANTFTGNLTIDGGTVIQSTSATALGAGTVILGDGVSGNNATLSGTGTGFTAANAITVAAGGTGTYTISNLGGNNNTYSGNIALNNNLSLQTNGVGTITLSGTITGANTITNNGTGTGAVTLSGTIGSTTNLVQNSASSQMNVNYGANMTVGSVTIDAGAFAYNAGDALYGPITLGSSSLNANATLVLGGRGVTEGTINVLGSGTNTIAFTWANGNQVFFTGGAITLNNNTVILSVEGNGASGVRVNGGITGTGNVIVDDLNAGYNGVQLITLVNNAGTVTNASTGTIGIQDTDGFGANVTSLIQSSTTSGFNVSSADTSFVGSAQVLSGSMQLTSATALDSANQVFVASGGTLDVQQSNNIAGLSNVSGSGGTVLNSTSTARTLTLGGTGSYVYSGVILDGGIPGGLALTMSGSGMQTLSGSDGYTGGTIVTSGTLRAANASALGNAGALAVYGGVLDMDGFSQTVGALSGSSGGLITSTVTNQITLTSTTSTTGTYAGVISSGSGQLGLIKTGTGALTLSGTNTYTGGSTISAGTLEFSNTNSMPSSGTVMTGSGATMAVAIDGAGQFTTATSGAGSIGGLIGGIGGQGAPVTWSSGAALGIDTTAASGTYAGIISNPGGSILALTKLGSNTLYLTNANSYTGATSVIGGTLQIGNGSAGSVSGNSALGVTGGATLAFDEATGSSVTQNIADSGIVAGAEGSGITNTLGGIISGTGVFTQSGAGATILAAANTYTGTTTISSGTIQLNNANAVQNSTATISSANGLAFGTGIGTFNLGGLAGASNDVLADTAASAVTLVIGGNNASTTYSGVLSGAGGITKTGTGTLTLSNGNTFSGQTTVNSGILNLTYAGGGPAALRDTITVNSGGELLLTAINALGFTGGQSVTTVYVNGGTVYDVGGAVNSTDQGYLTSFVLTGGTDTGMSGAYMNFDGSPYGITSNASSTTSMWGEGITLRANGVAITVAQGTTASGIDLLVSGPIIQSGGTYGITKNGAGTLEFTGANTYAGTTTINGGTLQIGNGTTGSLTSGALTFGGSGTFNVDEANGTSQSMGALTFSAGDGTVQSTFGTSGATILTFSSLARTAGATGNFVTSGGANGTSNDINLDGVVPGFISQGLFFGGTNYAFLSATNSYVRGINYGTVNTASTGDPGAFLSSGATSLTSTSYVEITGALTAQTTGTFVTLEDAGSNNVTLAASQTLVTNGILETGGSSNFSGGTGIEATSGGELVVRTSAATDAVTISDPIMADGASSLTKSGLGTLNLGATNTYTGATTIDAGTLNLTGTLSGGTAITINGGALSETSSGVVSGAASLTMSNRTSATLSGSNTYTGATNVNSGILTISGGAITASTTIAVGNTQYLGGAIYQSGVNSVVTNTSSAGGAFQIGSVAGAYGYYNLASGIINVGGEIDPGGSGGGAGTFGEFDMSGGTVNLPNSTSSYFLPDRGIAGEASVTNILGGTVQIIGGATPTNSAIDGLAVGLNNVGGLISTFTMGGAAQFLTPSFTVKLNDTNFGATSNSTNVSLLNMDGGVLQTLGFGTAVNSGGGNGYAVLNFNGGAIEAGNAGNTSFLSGLGAAYVYSGGGTINNNGQVIIIAQPLLAVTGSGVTSVALTSGGSGYIAPPEITFSGGDGTGATGYATINPATGAVTGIVITNPGTGYTSAPLVTLTGGGSGAVLGAVSVAADTSGGMTFTGAGTTTLSGANTYTGATVVNNGTLSLTGSLAGSSVSTSGPGIFSESAAGVIGGAGATFTQGGAGSSSLAGLNTYTGATSVTGGILNLSGAGSINTSSAITINGSGAELSQTSSAAVTPSVTLTTGTLTGTGTVNTVTVGDGTGGVIASSNASSALTIGTLTFNGVAAVNLTASGSNTNADLVTTILTTGSTNAGGLVTINTGDSAGWTNGGTYNLISYSGSILGSGTAGFTLGNVANLSARQSATLGFTAGDIVLTISGDSPQWTGLDNGNWQVGSTGPNDNWRLITEGTPTNYISGDSVLFSDSATGATAVVINAANVTPVGTTFNNSLLNYTVSSGSGYGIVGTGFLIKNGTGSVTISTNNSYSGGTTVNAGILMLTGSNSGAGSTTVNGGVLNIQNGNALGSSAVTVGAGGALQLQGGITTGTNSLALNGAGVTASPAGALDSVSGNNTYAGLLTLGSNATVQSGSGALTLSNAGTINGSGFTLTLAGAGNGSIAGILGLGTGGVTMNSSGAWTLSGVNTYTGTTVINSGTLSVSANTGLGSATVGQAPVTLNGGTLTTTNAGAFVNTHVITVGPNGGAIDVNSTGSAGTGQIKFNTASTLTGSGALTVTGNGVLGTTGAGNISLNTAQSTYAGNITLQSGGSLEFAVANAVGSGATFTIGNNGELVDDTGVTLPNNITVTGGTASNLSFNNGTAGVFSGNISLNANATVALRDWYNGTVQGGAITGNISGNGGLSVNSGSGSGGVLTLSGTNTYSGATTVAMSTLAATSTASLPGYMTPGAISIGGTSTLYVDVGGTGQFGVSDITSILSNVTFASTSVLGMDTTSASGGSFTYASNISGVEGITKFGPGTLVLSGNNSYTGATTLNSGALAFKGAAAVSGSSTLTINNGGALTLLSDGGATFTPGSVSGTGNTVFNGAANTINVADISSGVNQTLVLGGTTQFNTNGAVLTVNGSNGYSLTLSAVALEASGGTQTFNPSAGATLNIGAMTGGLYAGQLYGVINLTGSGTTNLTGAITQNTTNRSIAMTLNQTGTVTISGNNNFRNNNNGSDNANTYVNVNSGTTDFNSNNAIFSNNALIFNLNGGTIDNTSGSPVTLNTNGTTNIDGNFAYGGTGNLNLGANPVSLGGSYTITTSGSAALTIAGAIASSTSSLTEAGAGILALSASNAYSGGTTIRGGILDFANYSLGSAGAITVNGGTLQWASGNTQDISSRLTLQNGGAATLDTQANNVTLATGFGGNTSSSLTKAGSGTLALTGSNTYSGGTVINAGTLQINTDNSLGSTGGTPGGVTINNGATLEVLASSGIATARNFSLSGAGTLQVDNAATYTVNSNIGDLVPGNGSTLNASGSGALIIGSSSTVQNSGNVNVNAGTVLVQGAISGSVQNVNVNAGGTLGGGGTISAGAVNVATGGTLAPGALSGSAGTTLTINNTVTMSANSTLALNLNPTVPASDLIDFLYGNGDLDIGANDTLTVDLLTPGGAVGQMYTFAYDDGNTNGRFANVVLTGDDSGLAGTVDYSVAGQLTLDLVAIPEPGTWGMLLSGVGMLIAIQRARRRKY